MNPRRLIAVAVLALAPFVFLISVGSYHLYATGWGFIAWWPMMACFALAYLLGWRWTRRTRAQLLPDTGIAEPPATWTDRDRAAWRVVESRAAAVTSITVEQVADARRYADTAIDLALDVARVYRPDATDPFSHLTLPEIVTCAELVARDLNDRVTKYIPGSHLFSVNDWKTAKRVVDWGKTAMDVSWFARAVVNPINTGVQYFASKASGSILNRVQENVMLWFHSAFVHELGKHLIELNSGRLKVGADKYRDMIENHGPIASPTSLTIVIVGQVKAGKSSLANSLLGEHRAATDTLPATAGATKYELRLPDLPPMTLVDTAGYGAAGPTETEVANAVAVAENADLILVVGHARTAARAADVAMIGRLAAAFAAKPHLRFPPTIVALTHVDLLTPAMEWAPPYDWKDGTRVKETQMREAVVAARSDFGERFPVIVPVCAEAGKEWNIRGELAELLAAALDDTRGTALLKAFHTEGRAGAARKTVDQVLNAGREALGILWQSVKR
jgi:uncharacterized protein